MLLMTLRRFQITCVVLAALVWVTTGVFDL